MLGNLATVDEVCGKVRSLQVKVHNNCRQNAKFEIESAKRSSLAKVRVVEKHPLSIRWNHWINFPLLSVMIASGLAIYWANDVYIPAAWLESIGLGAHLASGMSWHFAFAGLFALNGVAYAFFLIKTRHFRYLTPDRESFREALHVVLHDLGVKKYRQLPVQKKYNAAQRLTYTGVFFLGVIATLSGFAIYKPLQLNWLLALCGGYEAARFEHFAAMILFLGFFVVHIGQVIRAGWVNFASMVTGFEVIGNERDVEVQREVRDEIESTVLRKRTRRAFFGFGSGLVLTLIGVKTLLGLEQERGLPWLLRKVNDVTDAFWHANFRSDARIATAKANGLPFRVNGDVGLVDDPIDEASFRLTIIDPNFENPLQISLQRLRELPSTSMTFDFKCIEGWSQPVECRGVKLSDFMTAFNVGRREDESPFPFVGLSSVNGGYYVSMDAKSFWHPQTLLCYEINGQPLKFENGAPLRLMTAVKYGVKNIKQLSRIEFTLSVPADYWAENGYQDTLMF